jgi:hypothetical protein
LAAPPPPLQGIIIIIIIGVARAAACIYDATIIATTTCKKDMMYSGASAAAGLWAARTQHALIDWRNNARHPGGAFPFMRQHANTIATATVDQVFVAVPSLNTNLRARFAGEPPPHLVPYQQAQWRIRRRWRRGWRRMCARCRTRRLPASGPDHCSSARASALA